MATAVIMPRQGQSVESCIIGAWHKQKGDKVSIGDVLFTYETDKATFEEEAKAEGVMLELFFEEGDEVQCLETVCVIGSEGESFDELRPASTAPAKEADTHQASHDFGTSGQNESGQGVSGAGAFEPGTGIEYETGADTGHDSAAESYEMRISPRARLLAEKTGADIGKAVPTGANGRVMEKDIQKVIQDGHIATKAAQNTYSSGGNGQIDGTGIGGRVTTFDVERRTDKRSELSSAPHIRNSATVPNTPDCEDIKLTGIRKVIAKTMLASLSNSAQLTQHSSFDATDIFSFRKKLKAFDGDETLAGITVTDIIVYAVSRVLLKHKSINAHFLGDKITLFNNAHVGVATDTPRGLLVPTIFNANTMSLTEISVHAKSLFEKCRQGSIDPGLLKGGTFTVSNLGGLGVEMFTPVLNPPQTGLLGVCSAVERTKDGKPYKAIGLSVTYDHQALDGADAARFAMDLIQYLESFSLNIALEGGLR